MGIHHLEKLTETKRLRNQDDDIDFEKEREQKFLLDELQSIQEVELCLHEPFQLDLMGCDYNGDKIIHIFQCKCGKKVTEFFSLLERRVL
jgi:hypothetical protein